MKKIIYIVPLLILIMMIVLFSTKNTKVVPTVVTYNESIDMINETCHIKTNDLDADLHLEYLYSANDNKLILYGNDISKLDNYINEEYYKNNKLLYLTINNEGFIYEIFSVFISESNDYNHTKLLFKDNEYEEHLNYLVNKSIFKNELINTSSKIITIQKQLHLNNYLIISARRI